MSLSPRPVVPAEVEFPEEPQHPRRNVRGGIKIVLAIAAGLAVGRFWAFSRDNVMKIDTRTAFADIMAPLQRASVIPGGRLDLLEVCHTQPIADQGILQVRAPVGLDRDEERRLIAEALSQLRTFRTTRTSIALGTATWLPYGESVRSDVLCHVEVSAYYIYKLAALPAAH